MGVAAIAKGCRIGLLIGLGIVAVDAHGQSSGGSGTEGKGVAPDGKPTLYTVSYAHLDTQWLWEYPHSIEEYLPATLHDNFALLEKYPGYRFNFTGANRYRMIKEYYPADYERLRHQVAAGRWFPGGSSMEEGDVNAPSPEAILRQILYGNAFFRRELGVAGVDYMLPDCFGFPWSLPSLLAHAGIKGFSTSKLTWGSSVPDQPTTPYGMKGKGIPFNVGYWVGPDGKGVVAALNPGDYITHISYDLSRADAVDSSTVPAKPQTWLARLRENRRKLGLPADYIYVGTGDIGGAPNEGTVSWVTRAARNIRGPIRVLAAPSDQFFRDLTPAQVARLPRYSGEMELTNHSAGSLTSQAYQKRWMHRNELLGAAAERASVAAAVLGAREYPQRRLNDAWTLVLAGHFHDIAAGTSTPKAHEYSWNDQLIALNQMAAVVTDASEAVAAELDTRAQGTALVVYNPLEIAREDVVEATVRFPGNPPRAVEVVGPDGRAVPAQVAPVGPETAKVTFLASVPSVGYAVYDVRPAEAALPSTLSVTERSLENARYRVTIDDRGDIAAIYDKKLRRQVLRAPIRLAIRNHTPKEFPAWNMDWADQVRPPRAYVGGESRISIAEAGPARVAVTIERELDSSRFVQTVRLAAGDAGERIEVANVIEWRESNAALKVVFPLRAANDSATYNWGVGTIRRGTRSERKFEVPSHQWIDLTDRTGSHGVTILTGDKRGSDKPDRSTIGLTLLLTPGLSEEGKIYPQQATQDWGRHEILYGLVNHSGDRRRAGTDWHGYRLDAPLHVFQAAKHEGRLGRTFSLVRASDPGVRIMAVKKAEEGSEYIVRIADLDGKRKRPVRLSFATQVARVRRVNGQEQPLADAVIADGGEIITSLGPYELQSFAVTLTTRPAQRGGPTWQAVPLRYERSVASNDGSRSVDGFDALGRALPAEMLPSRVWYGPIAFELVEPEPGTRNAIPARGQTIELPSGKFDRVYLLAASADGDRRGTFRVGDRAVELTIQDWGGYVGQWDNRRWKRKAPTSEELASRKGFRAQVERQFEAEVVEARAAGGDTAMARATVERNIRLFDHFAASWDRVYDGIVSGFVKPAPIAWYASHRHTADGKNESYAYSYLFAYRIELPPGAATLTLPADEAIRILAMTVAKGDPALRPAAPLHDTLER